MIFAGSRPCSRELKIINMYNDMYQSTNTSPKAPSSDDSLDTTEFKIKTNNSGLDVSSLSPTDGEHDSYDISRYIRQTSQLYNSEKDFTGISSSKHFRFVDYEKRNLRCTHCTYVTDRKNNLKRHIVTMHQECSKTLECCGIVFRSKAALREHVSFHHRGGYRCQICGRNFCRKALLRRHLTVHSGQKDYRCRHCAYATSHKSNLERHQKVHAKDMTKNGAFTQNVYEDAFDSRKKTHIDSISHNLTKWRLETTLPEMVYRQVYESAEKTENFKFKEQSMQQSRIFNWMNFNMTFPPLGRNPDFYQEDIEEEDLHDDVSMETNAESEDLILPSDQNDAGQANGQRSVKESFASYIQRYMDNETDEDSNSQSNDENQNNISENDENLLTLVKTKHKRCRLSANPYKCSTCGSTYASQRRFLKHGCGKSVKLGLYFPVTNMIRKGVALEEKNAKNNQKESSSQENSKTQESFPLTESTGKNIDIKPCSESSNIKSGYTYIL